MKAILLHITAMLTVALLVLEITFTWVMLLMMDIALISYLHNNMTMRELTKYSGYSIWYKLLRQ